MACQGCWKHSAASWIDLAERYVRSENPSGAARVLRAAIASKTAQFNLRTERTEAGLLALGGEASQEEIQASKDAGITLPGVSPKDLPEWEGHVRQHLDRERRRHQAVVADLKERLETVSGPSPR